ncbi:MAG TPA: LysR family transcriptional regulator [Myxococcales bacterium]|nr:LysR family transcriptional regulator [Myxococcales bacterium]
MLPDLDSLRYFEAAARLLNFAAAAREVGLSAPAFTSRIKRLEDLVESMLFTRNNRRVELTAAGIRLLPLARRTLEDAGRCLSAARGGVDSKFDLILGSFYEVGLNWLVPLLPELHARRPERSLHLRCGDTPDLLRNVREGAIDAALTSARISDSVFQHTPLLEVRFAFVATPALLQTRPFREREDSRAHVLHDVRGDLPLFRYFLDAQAAGQIWAFQRVEQLGTVAAVRRRVLSDVGVAVLPLSFIATDLDSGRMVRLFPGIELRTDQYRLVWSRDHSRGAELLGLARELSEGIARLEERRKRTASAQAQ